MKKKCTKCKEMIPIGDYYPSPKTEDGKSSWCKKCTRIKALETIKDRDATWLKMFCG